MAMEAYTFVATIDNFHSNLWSFHFLVPEEAVQRFVHKESRRVICTLNEQVEFQCALMPKGDGVYFINVNKDIRDQLKLQIGSQVRVQLKKDESEYGLPMPEELAELLNQDEEGNALFHALPPGKQRNMLFIANGVKNTDLRIHRAMVIVDHLKMNRGKIDFKKLGEQLKRK